MFDYLLLFNNQQQLMRLMVGTSVLFNSLVCKFYFPVQILRMDFKTKIICSQKSVDSLKYIYLLTI